MEMSPEQYPEQYPQHKTANSSPLLAIVGPTAVGKSEVAQNIAEKISGEIVSIDAFQIYKGMDIGTAKVRATERRIKHHLIDIVSLLEDYSVARFQKDARRVIDSLMAEEKMPVLVGGSGLYLDAVIDEMCFPKGEIQGEIRQKYERLLERDGLEALHEILLAKDVDAAGLIDPHNSKRIIRALEMIEAGELYSQQHSGLKERRPHYRTALFALTLPREELYERINARVDDMFEAGFLDEVANLKKAGLEGSLTAKQAIGYKEALFYLNGQLSLDDAKAEMKKRSRHYAKRQLSWIKRDGRAQIIDVSGTSSQEIAKKILQNWKQKQF